MLRGGPLVSAYRLVRNTELPEIGRVVKADSWELLLRYKLARVLVEIVALCEFTSAAGYLAASGDEEAVVVEAGLYNPRKQQCGTGERKA